MNATPISERSSRNGVPEGPDRMIRIAITQAAFEAICATLRLGGVGYENKVSERLIWLEPNAVNRLRAMRGHGGSYSDVIFQLVADAGDGAHARQRGKR
jgi:hypothetical protein